MPLFVRVFYIFLLQLPPQEIRIYVQQGTVDVRCCGIRYTYNTEKLPMGIRSSICIAAICAVCGTSLWGQDPQPNHSPDRERASRLNRLIEDTIDRIEHEFLWQMGYDNPAGDEPADTTVSRISFDSREGAIHFTGDVTIDNRDRIQGNIVVSGGSLTVLGRIEGDALVLNGDVIVESGGVITGAATVVNGSIRNNGGEIRGRTDETRNDDIAYRRRETARSSPYRLLYTLQEDLMVRDLNLSPLLAGYNRVEGLSLGLGSRKNLYWDTPIGLSLYGRVGYAFRIHSWRGMLGGAYQIPTGGGHLSEIGSELYSLTDTKDDWVIGQIENDLAAFLFHYDHRDYYKREGFSIYGGHYIDSPRLSAHLRVQYLNELHDSMPNRIDWALFAPDRSFRQNPAVEEGRLIALRTAVNLSSIEKSPRRMDGWRALAVVEHASPSLNSDLDYTLYSFDVRRYQPVSQYDNVNVRLRMGTSEGRLPVQRIYELGGIGTLPAFPHKVFSGNRMLLLNAEYVLRGDVLSQLAFIPRGLFGGLTILLFLDTGWTGIAGDGEGPMRGFSDFSFDNLNTSIGFGFGSRSGTTRLGFAWRTDRASSAVIFLRIARPF
jgi:cytoskeletal protein CcmA (bactofilin family)